MAKAAASFWEYPLPAEEVYGQEGEEKLVGPYPLAPGESWKKCPFDHNHIIRDSRYHLHIAKCERMYVKSYTARVGSSPQMVPCRFNDLHKMFQPLIVEHERECSDRPPYQYLAAKFNNGQLEKHEDFEFVEHVAALEKKEQDVKLQEQFAAIREKNEAKARDKRLQKENNEEDEDSDEWGKEDSGQTFQYDPYRLESRDGKRLLCRPLPGLCKSERKAMRTNVQIKFGILNEDGTEKSSEENFRDPDFRLPETNPTFQEVKDKDERDEKKGMEEDGNSDIILTFIPRSRSEVILRQREIQMKA